MHTCFADRLLHTQTAFAKSKKPSVYHGHEGGVCCTSRVIGHELIAPARPSRHRCAGEEFEIGAGTTRLNQAMHLDGFAGMRLFARDHNVRLAPSWGKGAQLPLAAKEQQFGDITKVEAHAAAILSTIFADF